MKLQKLAIGPAQIGHELISKVHWHLADVPVLFMFQDEPDKVKGKVALATARKLGAKEVPYLQMAIDAGADGFDQMPGFAEGAICRDMSGYSQVGNEMETVFVITVWEKAWERLSRRQRVALIDHELCHCAIIEDEETGRLKATMVGHDIEEFNGVVQRHGQWLEDVTNFIDACKSGQISMQFDHARDEATA